ncbi:MAG: hypothetical protein JW703_05280 [Candidatus Diapherotrites archaeon]|nr:hypothetical protein [Candidatus Diapherotrites archaeon]
MEIDFNLIIGFTGMMLILIAFLMNQTHKWSEDSLIYDSVNFLGSALLCFYALMINSYPFLFLNTVWALFSLKDIIKDLNSSRN